MRAGLLTYPVLMAADILLYDADRVPVGDDQRQHLELTRDVAARFNNRYGPTFVVPEAAVPKVAARVMDLQEPTRKMSKSVSSPLGTVLVLDSPEEIDRKVRKAVTDTETEVRYDPVKKPGVSNLLELLARVDGRGPGRAGHAATPTTARLKADVAEALAELLRPVRERYAELRVANPATWSRCWPRVRPRPGPWRGPPSTGPCAPPVCSRRPERLQRLKATLPQQVGAAHRVEEVELAVDHVVLDGGIAECEQDEDEHDDHAERPELEVACAGRGRQEALDEDRTVERRESATG